MRFALFVIFSLLVLIGTCGKDFIADIIKIIFADKDDEEKEEIATNCFVFSLMILAGIFDVLLVIAIVAK